MSAVDVARQIVRRAIADRVFPAASVEVGSSAGPIWNEGFGTLTLDDGSTPTHADTPFDLASLTKPIATATIFMELMRVGRVDLDDRLSMFFGEWRGADRESVTVRDVLEHASGLAARLVDAPPSGRREFEHEITRMRLECSPRTKAVYSDLGFILLGFLAADLGGAPLPALFERIAGALEPKAASDPVQGAARAATLAFMLPSTLEHPVAPTLPLAEDPRRGRMLAGEVHDNYAAALGGAAGHAGLFGCARDVGRFAWTVLRAARGAMDCPAPFSAERVALFTRRSAVAGSSRALAWDTMLTTSSCGTQMSASAFGHVGFTGTSLWIDPERDRYYVLLSNRACGGGTLEDMRGVRRSFHDALAAL